MQGGRVKGSSLGLIRGVEVVSECMTLNCISEEGGKHVRGDIDKYGVWSSG